MKRVFLLLFPRGPETLPAARFISFVLAQPAPHPFLPAGPFAPFLGPSRPSALSPSLYRCQADPARQDRLPPRPSRTLARVRPGHARRRVPLGPARQGPCSAPIKGTRYTLLALANPSSQNRRLRRARTSPPCRRSASPSRRHRCSGAPPW